MSDIFDEVDEDLRHERYKKLWEKFGPYVIGVAVLIVAVTAGYEGYRYWKQERAIEESDRYLAEIGLIDDGNKQEALSNLQALALESSGGYQALALFHAGSLKLDEGDPTGAMETFDSLFRNSSAPALLRQLAGVKAANLALDLEPYEQVALRLAPMLAEDHPFRLSALEIAGLNAQRAGKLKEAEDFYQAILDDPGAINSMRSRVNELMTLLKASMPTTAPEAANNN